MATTRKRKPAAEAAAAEPRKYEVPTVDDLADFLDAERPDKAKYRQALDLAVATAKEQTGLNVEGSVSHFMAQGIRLLAAKLLLENRLEGPLAATDVPLQVRAFWKLAGAEG